MSTKNITIEIQDNAGLTQKQIEDRLMELQVAYICETSKDDMDFGKLLKIMAELKDITEIQNNNKNK